MFGKIKSRPVELDNRIIGLYSRSTQLYSNSHLTAFNSQHPRFDMLDARQHSHRASGHVHAKRYCVSLLQLVGIVKCVMNFRLCRRPGILVLVNDTDWELLVCECRNWSKLYINLFHIFRANLSTNYRPTTTSCLFPLFTGDKYLICITDVDLNELQIRVASC